MKLVQNEDGTISVSSGYDEFVETPGYVTQYHTNVDEMDQETIESNQAIEAQDKRLSAAKFAVKANARAQTQAIEARRDKRTWLRSYLADVRRAAMESAMFGEFAEQESGFDISHAHVSPINELSGDMALSRQQTNALGSTFFLARSKADYGAKIIEPDTYKPRIKDTRDEFGYTVVTGDTLDKASATNARKFAAKNAAKTAILKTRKTRMRAGQTLRGLGDIDESGDFMTMALGSDLGASQVETLTRELARLVSEFSRVGRFDVRLGRKIQRQITVTKAALAQATQQTAKKTKKHGDTIVKVLKAVQAPGRALDRLDKFAKKKRRFW